MILYNVTVKIDHEKHEDWRTWMIDQHLPEVMESGCFTSYRMSKLLGVDELEGITYSFQYAAPDMASLNKYQSEFAPKLQADHIGRYEGYFLAFRTIMEVVTQS